MNSTTDHTDGKPMTNYNERLADALRLIDIEEGDEPGACWIDDNSVEKAKQAITSLIKELVAEAKPEYGVMGGEIQRIRNGGRNIAIDQFEQNLLKALEQL